MGLQNAFGDLALDDTVQALFDTVSPRFASDVLTYARVITASDTITPPLGQKIQLVWVAFAPDPDAGVLTPVTVGFQGDAEPKYCNYALSHWQLFEGALDQPLEIVLGSSVPVSVTIHYKTTV